MNKQLTQLMLDKDQVIAEQGDLFAKLIADSKTPDQTVDLLSQVTDAAFRYDQLCLAINLIIAKKSQPFWKRPFLE